MTIHAAPQKASTQGGNLERWISQRTGGRVHRLRVQADRSRVTVRGQAGSYHVRQLALAAVLDALEGELPREVHLEIEVQHAHANRARANL